MEAVVGRLGWRRGVVDAEEGAGGRRSCEQSWSKANGASVTLAPR